jgi:hypothetical protein
MPLTFKPLYIAVRVTARIAAFIPGASPPDVRMPIHFIAPIFISKCKLTPKDTNNRDILYKFVLSINQKTAII